MDHWANHVSIPNSVQERGNEGVKREGGMFFWRWDRSMRKD